VLQVTRYLDLKRTQDDAYVQSVIAKVRACRRTPQHPSWNECERRVQAAQ
jgi:hypothetical protein